MGDVYFCWGYFLIPYGIEFRMVDWEVPSKPGTRKEKIRWEEIQGLLYVTRMSGTADVDPGMHMESDYILLTKRFNLPLGYFGAGDVFGSRLTPRNVPKIVEMIKKGAGLEWNPSGYHNQSYPGWEVVMVYEKTSFSSLPEKTVTFRTFSVFPLIVFGIITLILVWALVKITLMTLQEPV